MPPQRLRRPIDPSPVRPVGITSIQPGQTLQPDPDPEPPDGQLDIEDALAARPAEPNPAAASSQIQDDSVARYLEEQERTAPQRRMWGDALRALEEIAKQPSPEELLANRYERFDYLFWPALKNAAAWTARLMELWTGDSAGSAAHPEVNGRTDR
jgi:hypothetical protein